MIRKVESEGLEDNSQRGKYMNKVKMARMRMEDPAIVILKRKIDKMKEKIQDIQDKKSQVDNINKDKLLNAERDVLQLEKRVKKMTLDISNKMILKEMTPEEVPRKMILRKMFELDEVGEALKETYVRLEANLELSTDKNIDMKL